MQVASENQKQHPTNEQQGTGTSVLQPWEVTCANVVNKFSRQLGTSEETLTLANISMAVS